MEIDPSAAAALRNNSRRVIVVSRNMRSLSEMES
jgi:hypothetical protein